MSEQALFEQAKVCLEQGEYERSVALLEECIEGNPEELTFYWYLGLVYLLQENEELAQEIWLSVFLQGNLEEVEQWTSELIQFLEIKIQENIIEKKLGNAKIIYDGIFIIDADYENIELLNNLVEALSIFASNLSFNKDYETASDICLEALNLNPDHSMSWHSLAFNYYHLENYSKAEESIRKAIELDDSFAQNYYVLGLILHKTENILLAIEAYEKAIDKNSELIDTYDNLGDIYLKQKKIDKALEFYQIALNKADGSLKVSICNKLANVYKELGNKPLVAFNLGTSAYFNDQKKEAIPYFEEFLESYPTTIDIYLTLFYCYSVVNQPNLAINLIEKALNLFPDHLVFLFLDQSILPILYEDIEEIKFYRERFSQRLDKLINEIALYPFINKKESLKILEIGTNYYLGFQGKNDLEIQHKYADYIHTSLSKIYPQWHQSIDLSHDIHQHKTRIGYISTRLHGLGKLYLGWLKYCDKSRFEIYVYDISGYDESIKSEKLAFRENFKLYSDHIRFIPRNIDDICPLVMADKLDILILPEIGLDTIMGHLSCLRLAPIQCTTWGHPMTSGSPTIDYFLSSDLMEPPNGEEHYSESLVRLPNLGFSIQKPILRSFDKKRSDFELREDSIIYLCCQSLLKYLPQYDYIFPSIAQRNKSIQFVFVDPFLGSVITESFKKRIDKVFTKFNLEYSDYCIFLKYLAFDDYLIVHQLSDIFLDSFSWSGGLTTKDAIACSLPVVTCPGNIMRARQSYGMLRMIGVTETIAETEAEYIEIAVRLGLDQEWRQTVRDKITANKSRLFNDQECIKGLETFFEEAVQKHSKINLLSEEPEK